jgi:hypothetical protein
MRLFFTQLCLLACAVFGFAQSNTQNIFGQIVDSESGELLFGASIVLLSADPVRGTTTDIYGQYVLNDLPVGRVTLQVAYLGYELQSFPDVLLTSGKALNLDIKLKESFNNIKEVIVKGKKSDKSMLQVDNEMATVSAMSYSLEQSTRYAGSNNDPSRLVLSFPGVRNQGDVQNGISIRGNTPMALQWNIEGLEVQSPNHFAREGALGAVNMMSSNVMHSVDFYTAAFPAQYANAGSGVFDIKYRKGNPDEYEFSIATGTLGVEASAEGPFSKKYKGSFLVSYRFSTLGILSKLGYNVSGNTSPVYQDFNYKIQLPTKKLGVFQIFGLVGDSYIRPIEIRQEDGGQWSDEYRLSMVGIKNSARVSDRTFLQSAVMYSKSRGFFFNLWNKERFRYNEQTGVDQFKGINFYEQTFPIIENRVQVDLKTSTKVSARHSFQSGINLCYIGFDQTFRNERTTYKYNVKNDSIYFFKREVDSSTAAIKTIQIKAFLQHKYRINENLSLTGGVSFIHLQYNKFFSVEPRIGMEYNYGKQYKLSAGFGMHSRLEPLGYYGTESLYWSQDQSKSNAVWEELYGKPNAKLQASRSVHLVLGNSLSLSSKLVLKTEVYFQYLYAIPVEKYPFSTISYASLNYQYPSIYNYTFENQIVYANKGKGINYGIDVSLEKSFAKKYYFLINASYYESKYKTPNSEELFNKKWLNTRYNGNFIFTTTAGKDIVLGKEKNNTIGVNFRTIWAGNNRVFDLTASEPFASRLRNYFRLDTRIAYTRNKKKYAWTLSLDMQNVTNKINESSNPQINSVGIIPFLNYKVQF